MQIKDEFLRQKERRGELRQKFTQLSRDTRSKRARTAHPRARSPPFREQTRRPDADEHGPAGVVHDALEVRLRPGAPQAATWRRELGRHVGQQGGGRGSFQFRVLPAGEGCGQDGDVRNRGYC